MCGGCLTHWTCRTDPAHIEWFLQFAAPGEVICGAAENPSFWPGFICFCELPEGHDGNLHKDRKGNAWGVSRARST